MSLRQKLLFLSGTDGGGGLRKTDECILVDNVSEWTDRCVFKWDTRVSLREKEECVQVGQMDVSLRQADWGVCMDRWLSFSGTVGCFGVNRWGCLSGMALTVKMTNLYACDFSESS